MGRQTIAFDIDDVLAANAEGFTEFSNKRWGTNLKPGDYSEHWAEMWGLDESEMEKRRQVILKEKLFTSYKFFNEAKAVLKELSKKYNLVIVSSRTKAVQKDTQDWLKSEYGELFSAIHFGKMWDDPKLHVSVKLKMTKTEICQEIGADYLVDDQPKHCFDAARAGIKTILYGDYEWNRKVKLIKNMARAKSWQDVAKYFEV